MPILQNNQPKVAFSLSRLPKFVSQTRFNQLCLCCHLLSSTISTLSSSTSSNDLFPELLPSNAACPYNSFIKFFAVNNQFVQTLFLFKKLLLFSKPELFVFPPLLKSCAFLSLQTAGFSMHGYSVKCGFGNWVGTGNSLILMYMKFGRVEDACRVFDEMPIINKDMFNSLVRGFGSNGLHEEVVLAFERMLELCILPHFGTVSHAIMACGELGSMEKAMLVHDFVIRNGYNTHVPIMNSLISMYIKMGRLDLGHCVFNDMHDRDIISWNSLITGYAQNENCAEAFNLFSSIKKDGNLVPNQVTLLGLLLACSQTGNLCLGKTIHGHWICMGLVTDFHLGTAIADMYAKCGRLECARTIFEEDVLEKTLVSWNSLIAGYSHNGYDREAAMLYERMIVESKFQPDSITFANVVPVFVSLGNIGRIQSIHALIVKRGLDKEGDVVLCTAMLDAYGKCSDLKAAKSMFTCIERPNTATWNAMIAAYNLIHLAEQSMLLFLEMVQSKVSPDAITMVMLFQSCGQLNSLKQGSMAHGYCLSKGFSSHLTVGNAIIDMYMRCGSVHGAEVLFNVISLRNVVTWNTMLFGYVKNGYSAMAMSAFCQMQSENHLKPDSVTMISFVQASAIVLAGLGGEISHSYILKIGLDFETLVMNSLIDAYAKNGLIENARVLFMQLGLLRDQSSWNVMIAGCGMNGQGREACDLFSKMEEDGYRPNSITFTSLLSSCSHSGLIEEGCRFFDMMVTKYKIQPSLEHWTCIVDMFGRAGRLEEAYQLLKIYLYQNSGNITLLDCDAVWGALLSACRMSMNMELGKLAGDELSRLAPDNCGYHMLLSNLYALSKRWDEAAKVRRVFEDGALLKLPGLSIVKF